MMSINILGDSISHLINIDIDMVCVRIFVNGF